GSQRRPNLERAMTAAIAWGRLKQLQQKAEDMMAQVGAMPTPENTLLASLALISTNLAVSIGGACAPLQPQQHLYFRPSVQLIYIFCWLEKRTNKQ
uniref:Uncharacterized protein n=1 Tax=Otus sunia TaxID=257818 RepID=A0A8C8EBF3_9STRI